MNRVSLSTLKFEDDFLTPSTLEMGLTEFSSASRTGPQSLDLSVGSLFPWGLWTTPFFRESKGEGGVEGGKGGPG